MAQTFKKTLDKSDFGLFKEDTQEAEAGTWNNIGQFTIPPQQRYAYGFGSDSKPSNQGYLFIDLQSDSEELEGKLRLVQEDANGLTKYVVYEEQADVLRGDKSDRQKKTPLPEQVQYPLVGEDSRMKIEFDPVDGDVTGHYSESQSLVPVTVRT